MTQEPRRCFPRGQRIRSITHKETGRFDTVTSLGPEHYPLVEIVEDRLWPGHWLYLHTTPKGTEGPPTFVPDGESLPLKASMLISSWYARSTPIEGPAPEKVATVYTAVDHLNR